jgi:hypothetical protein
MILDKLSDTYVLLLIFVSIFRHWLSNLNGIDLKEMTAKFSLILFIFFSLLL